MDFTLGEDQELLRDTARRLLTAECPPSLVRAHIEDRSAARALWGQLSGWVELGDGPLVDLCLFLEETGAVCAPGPFLATALLYAPLARTAGGGAGGAGRAPAGDAPAGDAPPGAATVAGTVAVAGASGVWEPNREPVKTFVLDADLADRVAVVGSLGGAGGGSGGGAGGGGAGAGVAVVERDQLLLRPVETLDPSRRVFEVTVPDGLQLAPLADDVVEGWLARAHVGLAAEMLGTTRWLLERSLSYAKERVQFSRPIGSFQAIQHKLANMALALERAWAAVYYAAMVVDAGDPDRTRAAHVAKASAGEAARLCAKDAIQIHGGIGFTYEHDLHLWMRRAFASEHLLGTVEWHQDRLADLILV